MNEVLKIEFFADGKTQDVYLALDRNDLHRLRSVIDRAIAKTQSLTDYLDGIGLGYFELEPPE